MGAWESLRQAIGAGDASRVAEEVLRLDEAGRKEVARELPGHIAAARDAAHERYHRREAEAEQAAERAREKFVRDRTARGLSSDEAHEIWWGGAYYEHGHRADWAERDAWIEPMRVAGAGTLSTAAAVATWLYRRDFTRWRRTRDLDPLLRVITARSPQWQADLAVRLALRLRATRAQTRDDSAELALEMLRRTGAVPPAHDPLVVAWVSAPSGLEHDPLAGHLVPRIFEAEGVGRALREDRVEPPEWDRERHSWLRSLRDLADAGRLDRDLLVDGCVRRFLLGGDAADLRFFVRLHDLLSPAPSRERARDYLRLLPAAPGPVAELALRELRRAGGLSGEEAGEAVEALLFRAEGKLVRAGLTLLDRAARDAEGGLDHLAPALASAFLSESYEVQERAVRLAVRHAGRFSPVGAEAVREAATGLPPEPAARLSAAYGEVDSSPVEEADDFRPVPLPSFEAPAREPFPPAFGDLTGTYTRLRDGIEFERWLDGFVRDPAARTAGKPLPDGTRLYGHRHWTRPDQWAEALLREAAGPDAEPPVPEPERAPVPVRVRVRVRRIIRVHTAEAGVEIDAGRPIPVTGGGIAGSLAELGIPRSGRGHVRETPSAGGGMPGISTVSPGLRRRPKEEPRDRLPDPGSVSPPHRAMLLRCAEVHAALKAGTLPPYLLATPTLTSGHIDPAELVARLEGYERAGARALPADLQQALLRLPREVDPDVVARGGRLTSEPGVALAHWLKDRPEPVTRVDWSHGDTQYTHDRQPGEPHPRLHPRIRLEPAGPPLLDVLLADPSPHRWEEHGAHMDSWRLLLPSDREAVAVHLLPHLLNGWDRPGHFHRYVAELFHQDGPVGEGVALLVAYLLADRGWYQSAERGRELLLRAVAAGCLPAAECGRQLGLALRRTAVKLNDALSSLEECARQGAHKEVWEIMAGLLPVYLPGPGERTHSAHTRALVFAAEAARRADACGPIPEIAQIAARKATSGFVRAARALHERLDR
ncbi:hypothetical protein Pta02_19260 [Planobispora takensis]|uniref:DUF7824 domain-containing protein n=1 Tax=Planobispora takensis TaxID=1367882 RepID=A0A8J3WT32_9ACTN|nr:hypothetical protein Pta02_19260 [Planobispora takensis]